MNAKFENTKIGKGFIEFLNHDELHSKVGLFGNGSATVCCEIVYKVTADSIESQKIDKTLREELWTSYQDGLCESFIIQVKDKQFKVRF